MTVPTGAQDDASVAIDIDSPLLPLTWLLDQITQVYPPKVERWAVAKSILELGER